jgi:hypothetical protein
MKMNKVLKKMAAYNPTKQTFQMTTSNLCEKIESNEITLPLYQRDVSWTLEKSVNLLNYQLNGKAPVSPISVNKITDIKKEHVSQVSFIDREIIQDVLIGQLSIADGQQRLATNYKAYNNHTDFRNVVLDLARGNFLIVESSIKKHQILVGILLNKDNDVFFDYINSNSTLNKSDVMSLLVQVRSKLRDYNYTINLAEDLTEDEQIEWFEVLNNAGSRVTRIQMNFSKLKLDGVDIYTQYTKPYIEKLESRGLDLFDVKSTEVSTPVASLNSAFEVMTKRMHSLNYAPIPSDAKEKQLCSLTASELKDCFNLTLNALERALNFIEDNALPQPQRLDYVTYLTGYFVFLGENVTLDENKKLDLIKWYNKVDFTNKSNGERRKIFDDLIKM